MNRLLATLASIMFLISLGVAQSAPPRIYYSDLTSGPNVGGQNNAGAFVTVYGTGFGSTRGASTVTIGGGSAASYQIWSKTKVTFQLGPAAKSGNIVIHVSGNASNSVPFKVSEGKIYFVSPSGSSINSGSYNSPLLSLRSAKNKMAPGDIVYVRDGLAVTNTESSGASLLLRSGGTASAPKAIVAYPGSTVTLGSSTGANTGVQITSPYWVLSGLTIRGSKSAIALSDATGVRVSSSDVSCPNGQGNGACISAAASSSLALLGNYVHDTGSASSTRPGLYEAVAFTGGNSVEVGWNEIGNTRGCNALMFSSDDTAMYTLSVHDNYIHDARCAAVSFGAVDPSLGEVSLYNNVISNVGTGPYTEQNEASGGYAAIVVKGGSLSPVHAFNNTIYHAGVVGGSNAGAVHASGALELTNNIFHIESGAQYVSLDTELSWLSGANNLFHGAGTPPGVFQDSVVGDPELASPSTGNFHLLATSPAISAGTSTSVATDFDGTAVPQNAGFTIGAYDSAMRRSLHGVLAAAPTSVAFGSLTVGQSGTGTTVITNTGNSTVTISQATSNNTQFKVVSFPSSLNAGKSGTLTMSFTPSASGSQSGTVSLSSNAINSPLNIGVSGTGVAAGAPGATLSAASLTFASQVVKTTSAAQAVTLSNSGNASLSISSIVVAGDFAATNTCGSALAAGASCSISVTFTPTVTGTRTGTITITDNASSKTQQITLTGTGAAAPTATLQASSSSLSFGSVTIPANGTQSITITNTGTASATVSSISSSNTVFTTSGITVPATIAAGGSATFTVVFTPAAAGTVSGTLTVQSNATNPTLSVALSGTGQAAPVASASLSGTRLSFASQVVKTTSAAQAVTLSNSGNASLSISSIVVAGDFAATNTCGSALAAGASCSISVTFTPTVTGTRTGTITITDNASSKTQQITLTGTGAAAPTATLQASSSSLSFGSITIPANGTQSITITNTGTASATVSSISSSNTVFTTSGITAPATIAAGGSATFTVVFTPAAAGTVSGTLTVQSNATNPTLSVALSGTGAAAVISHSVSVSWSEPSSTAVGYNVYRSTQSGTGYTKSTSSPVATAAYTDTSVTAGATYYYVVTAVDASGNESAYSAQASATVPTP